MNDSPRRSPLVRVLDMILGAAAAVQAGPTPQARVRPATSRMRLVLALAVVVALAGTGLLVWVFVRAPGGADLMPEQAAVLPGSSSRPAAPGAAPSTPASPSPSASRHPSSATPSASAASLAFPSLPPRSSVPESAPAALTARYATTAGLLGYRMTVTIANPAAVAQQNWRLAVTLPRATLTVANVSGATAKQDGATWTFTPDDTTARVAPAGSVTVTFEVRGATLIDAAPRSCEINGDPCG